MGRRFLYLMRHGHADSESAGLSDLGREQARLAAKRMSGIGLAAITSSPLPRARETAEVIAEHQPGVPVVIAAEAGDYIPANPDLAQVPEPYAEFVAGFPAAERERGSALGRSAIAQYSQATLAGPDTHELVVTHNYLIGWLVSQSFAAPDWYWMLLNSQNCALTVLLCRPALPPALLAFNDAGHLPPHLRWTGFPQSMRTPGD